MTTTNVTFDTINEVELAKVRVSLKNTLLTSWSVSIFIFISVIAVGSSKKKTRYGRFVVYGLMSLSILVLLLSIISYSDDIYNTLPYKSLSLRNKVDTILYIIMTTILILVQIAYVIYVHHFIK